MVPNVLAQRPAEPVRWSAGLGNGKLRHYGIPSCLKLRCLLLGSEWIWMLIVFGEDAEVLAKRCDSNGALLRTESDLTLYLPRFINFEPPRRNTLVSLLKVRICCREERTE